MSFKIVTNPVTGKSETQTGPNEQVVQQNLEKSRRELRDMIAGNTQFHDDPNKAPPEAPTEATVEEKKKEVDWASTGYWGYVQVEDT